MLKKERVFCSAVAAPSCKRSWSDPHSPKTTLCKSSTVVTRSSGIASTNMPISGSTLDLLHMWRSKHLLRGRKLWGYEHLHNNLFNSSENSWIIIWANLLVITFFLLHKILCLKTIITAIFFSILPLPQSVSCNYIATMLWRMTWRQLLNILFVNL